MKFNERKFEQMTWGKIKDIEVEAYETPFREEIKIRDKSVGPRTFDKCKPKI